MLKQITHRKFSKTAQRLIIFLIVVVVIAVFILLLIRPPKKIIEPERPLGILNQSGEFRLT